MDVLTVILSVLLAVPVQLGVMYLVYSRWILPAINEMVSTLPSKVREFVEPFVNEKMDEVKGSLKASTVRMHRTITQAAAALDLDGIDLDTDEGIRAATEQLSARYPMEIAIKAVERVIDSIEARKKASNDTKGVSIW